MENSLKTACPDRDMFAKVFLNEAAPEERDALIDHVLHCPVCTTRFFVLKKVAKEFRSLETEFLPMARRSLRELQGQKKAARPGRAWPAPARLAAGLLVVLGILSAAYLVVLRPLDTGVLRSGETSKLRLLEPEGRIADPPFVFRWTPIVRADTYTFELIGDDLRTIVRQGGLKQSSFKMPAALQNQMVKGKPYVWTVEVYDDLGLKVDSDQQYFEIE